MVKISDNDLKLQLETLRYGRAMERNKLIGSSVNVFFVCGTVIATIWVGLLALAPIIAGESPEQLHGISEVVDKLGISTILSGIWAILATGGYVAQRHRVKRLKEQLTASQP